MIENDGIPFRDQDWSRLRKIAEGNPDDDKIGAFGVGTYLRDDEVLVKAEAIPPHRILRLVQYYGVPHGGIGLEMDGILLERRERPAIR